MDEEHRHEQIPHTDDPAEPTAAIPSDKPQTTQPPTATQDDQSKKFYRGLTKYEFLSIMVQGGIFISTVIYMIFAGLQWYSMNQNLRLTAKSTDIARRAADVAEQTLSL